MVILDRVIYYYLLLSVALLSRISNSVILVFNGYKLVILIFIVKKIIIFRDQDNN